MVKRSDFSKNWRIVTENGDEKEITLPYDAMQYEPRSAEYTGGRHIGYFKGADYLYEKEFFLSEEELSGNIFLEFEGVYNTCEIFLNGEKAGENDYGYNDFFVDITPFSKRRNHLEVKVCNSRTPNSRWYTGSGIYRPVTLWTGSKKGGILPGGIKIKTLSYKTGSILISVFLTSDDEVQVTVYEGKNEFQTVKRRTEKGKVSFEIKIPDVKYWSAETSFLYRCKASTSSDEAEEVFGVRQTELNEEKGLLINGQKVLLKGCCIHHDNGILGAEEYAEAAERKIRKLKECGYNAVRSAHNPCSKALLRACDKLGMYMVDEYADMWYLHKNRFDYAGLAVQNYRRDIRLMVEKDYNHPCVIMYSSGNEVAETAQKKGVEFTKTLTDFFHEQDDTRPVTCGLNIFFNFMATMGVGMASATERPERPRKVKERKKEKSEQVGKKKTVGSEFFNNLAGTFGSDTMKVLAVLPPCDWVTKGAFANLDVAGYNYGITRYEIDHKKYPHRFILGSETFITDACAFIKKAEKYPRIIGDFSWSGIDYIGEVGLGSLDYADYAEDFGKGENWLTAGCGCLDITGEAQGHTAYTQVVYGKRKIAVAVQPADHSGEGHVTSAWRKIHAFESWSWNGCNGHPVLVEVFTWAPTVKLYINGKCVGKKKSRNCRCRFFTTYFDGEVLAVGLDKKGGELCRASLKTAGEETVLKIYSEEKIVKQGGLGYLQIRYCDRSGQVKPLARGIVSLQVKGGKLLGFGNGCPYNKIGYKSSESDTYYGKATAVVLAESEEVFISASSPYGEDSIMLKTGKIYD